MGGLAAALVALQLVNPQAALRPLVERTQHAGWMGPLLLGALYVPAMLVGIPATLLSLTAGWLFGTLIAFLVAVPASTVGACATFAVGRLLSGDPQFLARGRGDIAEVARGLGTRKGFWTVLVLRLAPVTPFSVLNFAFGATPISLRAYALATLIGSIPASLGLAYAGAWLCALQ